MAEVRVGEVAESALRLADEFAGFGPAYMRWVRTRVPEGGLTYARMRLLGSLHCGGTRIMSGISDELGVTKRNVTALVDALEEEGLVRRRAHPTDRRATIVELTDRGERAVAGGYESHRAAVAEVFEVLSEGEREELGRMISVLRERLGGGGEAC